MSSNKDDKTVLFGNIELERAYISAFSNFRSGLSISEEWHGKRSSRNSRYYPCMVDNSPYYFKSRNLKSDKWPKYRSEVLPLIHHLDNISGNTFSSSDRSKLSKIFNAPHFRRFITYDNGFHSLNSIIDIISVFALSKFTFNSFRPFIDKGVIHKGFRKDFECLVQEIIEHILKDVSPHSSVGIDNYENLSLIAYDFIPLNNSLCHTLSTISPSARMTVFLMINAFAFGKLS